MPRKVPKPAAPSGRAPKPGSKIAVPPKGGWRRLARLPKGGGVREVQDGTYAVRQAGGPNPVGWMHRPSNGSREYWILVEGVWAYPGPAWDDADWNFVLLGGFSSDYPAIGDFISDLRAKTAEESQDSGGYLNNQAYQLRPWEHAITGYDLA